LLLIHLRLLCLPRIQVLQRVRTRSTGPWRHPTHQRSCLGDLRSPRAGNAHMHLLRHALLSRDLLAGSVGYSCHGMALRDAWVLLNTRRIW
jgi:hypothetical protein